MLGERGFDVVRNRNRRESTTVCTALRLTDEVFCIWTSPTPCTSSNPDEQRTAGRRRLPQCPRPRLEPSGTSHLQHVSQRSLLGALDFFHMRSPQGWRSRLQTHVASEAEGPVSMPYSSPPAFLQGRNGICRESPG